MPLESGTTIAQLDSSWPLGGDPTNRGDDHLRLIKFVLQSQFAGVDGDGFKVPITATEQELNWLGGLTSNVQDQLDDLSGRVDGLEATLNAPAGTKLAFHQAAPPLGWTQDVTVNDAMLRVVSGSGGATGGVDSAILNDKVPSHTHTVSGASSSDGAHTHSYKRYDKMEGHDGVYRTLSEQGTATGSSVINSAGDHTHTMTGIADANAGAGSWAPKYADMIIATKD